MISSLYRRKLIIISLLIFVLLTGCGTKPKISTIDDQEHLDNNSTSVELQVDYGYDGYGKYGGYMPIYTTIKNQGAAFTGLFQVIIPNQHNKSTLYQQEVSLGLAETAQLELAIPLNGSRDQFHYQLVDNSNQTIIEKTVNIKLVGDQAYTFIGILAKNSTGLEYIGSELVKTFYLQNDKLADDYKSLNPLDIILIDDYDLANITSNNWTAIENWVREGGTLIIGSVPIEEIPLYKKTQEQPREKNPIFKEYNLNLGKIQIANINLRIPESSNQQEKLLQSSISEDSTNIKNQTQGSEIVKRMIRSLPESKKDEFSSMYSTPYYNYRVLDTLKITDAENIPSTWFYVLILLAYVFIVGPVLYLILQKKDVRSLTWIMVPVLALAFAGILFLLGKDTRKTQTTGSYITYQTIGEDGNYIDKTYFSLISPKNNGYEVNNLGMESLGIIANQYSYASTGEITEYDYSSYSTGVTRAEGTSSITVKAAATFEPTYYTYTQDGKSQSSYQYNITDGIDKITGEFTNELGYDLEDGVLLCNQVVIPIGDVKYQETISLDELSQISISTIELLYDINRFGEILFNQSQVSQTKDSQTLRRYYAMQGYIENAIMNYNENNFIIGFPPQDMYSQAPLIAATDTMTSGMTVVVLPLQIDLRIDEGDVVIPNLMPYVESTDNYDLAGYRYMTHEMVDIRYGFNPEDAIRGISYSKRGNNEYTAVSQNQNSSPPIGFYGEIYFYNNRSKEYDLTYRSGVEGVKTELADYLDENNSILIRYKVDRLDVERGVAMLANLTATKGGN